MIRAFGWCNDPFDPHSPGRLCRGRERWIEGLPDTPHVQLYRTVISGAIFSDDSARDAQRGFVYSGVGAGRLLVALFPGNPIFGVAENGDPRTVPTETVIDEDWSRPLQGGLRRTPAVRWIAQAKVDQVDEWMSGEANGRPCPIAEAFIIARGSMSRPLIDATFLLLGQSVPDDRPALKYCPTALVDVLQYAAAVVLLHLDKHSPVMAVYTTEPLESDGTLDLTARSAGAFPVPFAIPPMLARWDRALYELRMDWDPESDGDFPVPPADDTGGRWSSRRKRLEEREAQARGDEE